MKKVIENVPHCKGNVCFITSLRYLFAYHGYDFSEAITCWLGRALVQIFPSCLELRRFYRKVASLTNDEYQYKDGAKLDYAWRKVEENDAETISEISDIEERAFMLFQGI